MSKYFEDREIECKCGCGEADMDSVFMERLDMLRFRYNRPIILNSAFRCLEHNVVVGGVADSPHTKGIAVDIRDLSTWMIVIKRLDQICGVIRWFGY